MNSSSITRRIVTSAMLLLIGLLPPTKTVQAQDGQGISFDRQIRPLLSDRCFACHGPDAAAREAGLRLDVQDDAHGYAIIPGEPEESELWARISSDDESTVMPPPDSHKKPLTADERQLIKTWIAQGGQYEKFWAFQTPVAPDVPQVDSQAWQQPVDAFVYRKLSQANRQPSSPADARTLIRRVSLDLTGLPPSAEQIDDYLKQVESVGFDKAWEQLVDRLLASPHYGEHMARYWLDVARFADTNGMHKDFYRNHWAYRDWVIRSFNENLPYDQFVRDQLAGDLYSDPTPEQLTATAFNRMHLIIDRGTALPEESFHKNVIDRVTAVGTAFMGLTLHCAQCHDHKYDPLTMKEFYSLYAFFNNLDAAPETVRAPENGLQPPFISLADENQKGKLADFDQQLANIDKQVEELKQQLAQAKAAGENKTASENEQGGDPPASQRNDVEQVKSWEAQIKQLQQQRGQIARQRAAYNHHVPYAMVMKERGEVRPTHLLLRGQYDQPGDLVQRKTPAFLPKMETAGETPTRLDLANWLTDPKHPLTSRVAVNRIWQQLFGIGLVKTAEDFGAQGDVPSHPELLDYLATSFVDHQWDVKRLVKEIVMSQTYRQSSVASAEQFRQDPDNRMLARGSRYRMDAEMIRDQVLATSGLLNPEMFGPSVKPPQPDGLWKAVTMIGERYVADSGDDIVRRSLYTYWKRGMPPPQMTILNAPIRDACVARRERTNTPSQALLLLNEPEYMKAARTLAQQTLQQPEQQRIKFAWERVTCQLPDAEESQALSDLLADMTQHYQANPELAQQACPAVELSEGVDQAQLAAWTLVVNAIYNLDITKNRN